MAGWSMTGSDAENNHSQSLKTKTLAKLRSWFDQFHSALLGEICSLRPVPPFLGDSGCVADLFKLFVVVRNKGGCDVVSRGGLWASVAEESGVGQGLAVVVKLVYFKYLDCFERWLDRVLDHDGLVGAGEECLLDIQDEFKGFLAEITDNRKSAKVMAWEAESVDSDSSSRKRKKSSDSEDNDGLVVDLDMESEEERRVRLEKLLGILNWVRGVARDPGALSVGSLPEPQKWQLEENAGGSEAWKKILLAREALFRKRDIEKEQKNQRMHPSMYSDQPGSAYSLRVRLSAPKKLSNLTSESQGKLGSESPPATSGLDRSISGSADGKISSSSESLIDKYSPTRVRTGQEYQAQVPDWTGVTFESDPKWLGTKVWPLNRSEHKFLLERDPIGKGRQSSCGCEFAGSVDCVRFHIAEKRLRVKRELGTAFYLWRFNKMGEDVTLFWSKGEEKRFDEIVISNPPLSFGSGFWDRIRASFRSKSREDLVSYYFNVFVLRRRAHQNRFTPGAIDSDDEEMEESSGSMETSEIKKPILLTPNKHSRK